MTWKNTTPVSDVGVSTQELVDRILEAPSSERPPLVERYLTQRVAPILNVAPEKVPTDREFVQLGLDSLILMDVIGSVTQDFRLSLYPRELFERPTIAALAAYLAIEIDHMRGTALPGAASRASADRAVLKAATGADSASSLGVTWTAKRAAKATRRTPGVVLLLSSPRAGSTLLRVMLAGHPRLFCPPELHLLPFDSMKARNAKLEHSYLGEGLQRAVMEVNRLDAATAKTLLDGLVDKDAPIEEIYALLRRWADNRLIVDKSPSYAANLETLERAEVLFDHAKYVHLVRHPYAVIESVVRNRLDKLIGISDVEPAAFAEDLWATSVSNVLDFFEEIEPERSCTLRFEDLVCEPARVMDELCAFLGVPFDDAVLKPYDGHRMTNGVHAKSWGIGDPNFLKHSDIDPELGEVWQEPRLHRRLGGFARRIAQELEYELPGQT